MIVDHGVEQVIRADRPEWVPVFTGLSVRQSQELVRLVADFGISRKTVYSYLRTANTVSVAS